MTEVFVGMDALQKQFRAMEYSLQQKTLRDVVKAGMSVLVPAEKSAAPGGLAAGMKGQIRTGQSDLNEAIGEVGEDSKHFYGYFYNLGTGQYFAREKARELGKPGLGSTHRSARKHHQISREFFIETFDKKKAAMEEAMNEKAVDIVTKAVG